MRVSLTRLWGSILLIVVMVLLSGCLGNRDWQYPPSTSGSHIGAKADIVVPVKAIVLPLEDLRGQGVKEEYWKAAIPLVPYGDTMYERPEAAENPEEVDVIRFDPPHDFAKAIAAELSQAGIFSSVTYVQDDRQEPADVVFRGRLRSTEWKRRLYSYLFGPVGAVFWFLGVTYETNTTTSSPANFRRPGGVSHWTDG